VVSDSLGAPIATVDHDEIDWQNVRHATVAIHQSFRYDYPGRVTRLRQRLMVVPPDQHRHQRLVSHKLWVSGNNLETERSYDSFGNVVLELGLAEVDAHVEFVTRAIVECHQWTDEQEDDGSEFDRRFVDPSDLTQPDDALRAVSHEAMVSGAQGLELAAILCARVHDHFIYEGGVTTVATSAAEAWAGGRGVCQDYAHCMLVLCRLCGLPARYVSGHLLGDGGSHAWVELLVPGSDGRPRTVAFDPTHDRRAGPRYVTVALGRDYLDVTPTSGTFHGPIGGELTTSKRAGVIRVEYL
jgi:transglutaminase-like putative cysteine protease